ncbi:DinB family protein [Bacillaceae bacterium]
MLDALLTQVEIARDRTLQAMEDISEAEADIMPDGFSNTIRWNLGHILTIQEQLVFSLAGEPMQLPENYPGLFGNGTRPSEWKTEPPSLETLARQLREQTERLKSTFAGRLEQKAAKPFKQLETIWELVAFSVYHEGIHQGVINGLKRVIRASTPTA